MNCYKGQCLYLWPLCIMNMFYAYYCAPTHNQNGLSLCNTSITAPGDNVIECSVSKGQNFDYRDLRNWTENVKDVKYSVKLMCDGGFVLLPWPFKVKNIISLEVNGCTVEGFLSEMTVLHPVPDELKTLILDNVSIEIPFKNILELSKHVDIVPRETDCGQLSLEKLVLKGIHYDIQMSPEERDSLGNRMFRLERNIGKHHHASQPCVYSNLRYIDESGSRKSGHYHLRLLPDNSEFPKLEMYNMSGNDLGHIPEEFINLHSKKFPMLRHIDFSNNALREFEFDFPTDLKNCHVKFVDLRRNQIASIATRTTELLKNIGTLLVDLRQNPLPCNCQLTAFRQYLQTQYQKTTDVQQRQLVSDITCENGSFLPGKLNELSLLDASFDRNCVK